ncbi:MAG: AAA family ATPase [Deltaproteobacteria bacterium]|nr:AAA family ATPase [Deltaproteobacteria bacterium]
MDLREEILSYYNSKYPYVYIITFEEERVMSILSEISNQMKIPMEIWSASSKNNRIVKDEPIFSVLNLLEQIATGEKRLVLLKDFHVFINHPVVMRVMRDITHLVATKGSLVVISSPVFVVPLELSKEIAVIDLPLPTYAELREVFNTVLVERGVVFPEEFVETLIRASRGLTIVEAYRVFNRALAKGGEYRLDDIDLVIEEKRKIIRKYDMLDYIDPEEDISSVGGLFELKKWLVERERAFSDDARRFGLPPPKGLLLLGVQGCGKSLMAKVIANMWKLPLLRLDMSSLYTTESTPEEALRNAIKVASSLEPIVLWIDEIEKGFSGVRENSEATTSRSFGMFITWMQEKKEAVFVVATANDVSNLPPELLRKGRFDEIFFIDLPDVHEREEIFKIHLRKRGRNPDNFRISDFVKITEHFSGAEIEQVIIAALFKAFSEKRELTDRDIEVAIRETVPLYETYEEDIKALRDWASSRTRFATVSSTLIDMFKKS